MFVFGQQYKIVSANLVPLTGNPMPVLKKVNERVLVVEMEELGMERA